MKEKLSKSIRIALSLVIGLLLLWLITRGQDLERLLEEFRQARYIYILPAMLLALLSHLVRALRWKLLIQTTGHRVGTWQTFGAVLTAYLANLALPRLGEITRCAVLARASGMPASKLFGTVLSERAFDAFTLLTLVIITLAWQYAFLADFLSAWIWEPMRLKGSAYWLTYLWVALAALLILVLFVLSIRKRMRRAREHSFLFYLRQQWHGLKSGISALWRMKGKWLFLVYTLITWSLYLGTVYVCFFAVRGTAHLDFLPALTLLALGSLGILAPVPGGVGTYHFMIILGLTELYGISPEPATSYAYISHAMQVLVSVLAGGAAWMLFSAREKKVAVPDPEARAGF